MNNHKTLQLTQEEWKETHQKKKKKESTKEWKMVYRGILWSGIALIETDHDKLKHIL